MTTSISIGTSKDFEMIRSQLGRELGRLEKEGCHVSLAESSLGDYKFLDCSLERADRPEEEMILRHNVANAISEYILTFWENRLLGRMAKESYYYLNGEEKENVLQKAHTILDATLRPGEDDFLLYRLNRKSKILHQVLDYLSLNSRINIDGFVKFRLQDYADDLRQVLEEAVDEYMLEKEYQEFIMLLKYFVDIQEPRVEKIHVVLVPGGSFQLFDDKNKVITNEFLEGFIIEMIDNQINYEDLLISALITIAPREVILHIPEPDKIATTVKTIQGVFGERAVICPGCSRCLGRTH